MHIPSSFTFHDILLELTETLLPAVMWGGGGDDVPISDGANRGMSTYDPPGSLQVVKRTGYRSGWDPGQLG